MVFHWRLSDSKSPQVSSTLLSVLAVFSNAVVWMVSTRPSTSKSSRPFNDPLVTVPKAPITIGIIVTFMFHSFFNSLARSSYYLTFQILSVLFCDLLTPEVFKLYIYITTLCRWSAKQTIPLSVLARNQTKGLDSISRTRPEVSKGTRVRELDEGTHRRVDEG